MVIDCSSYIANDILSAVALMEADSVLRLANCDLKSIGYLSSQLPLLRELHWDEDKQYKAASNIKPLQAADRIGQVLGSVAFQLPHSQELEEQYLEGTLLNDLSMKDSKAFRRGDRENLQGGVLMLGDKRSNSIFAAPPGRRPGGGQAGAGRGA